MVKQVLSIAFCMIVAVITVAATKLSPITIPLIQAKQCQDFIGTWHGFAIDPNQLFYDGGPWPVTVTLNCQQQQQQTKIYGMMTSTLHALHGELFASYDNGSVTHLYVDTIRHCGGFGLAGLINQNSMMVERAWENAMTGTRFIIWLTRVNTHYTGPKFAKVQRLATLQSCQ